MDIFFVEQGVTGTCSQGSPCSLAAALALAGPGDVIFLFNPGNITESAVLQANQQLHGFGVNAGQPKTITLPDGRMLVIPAAGGRATLAPGAGATAVTLANNVLVDGIGIFGGAIGIGGTNVTGATINDVLINATTGDGIAITNASTTTITQTTVTNAGGNAINLNNNAATLNGITITNATQAGLVIGNNSGISTVTNLDINGTGGDGIQLNTPGGTLNFINADVDGAGANGVQVAGGTGDVTFDAASSIGAMTSSAGTGFFINGGATSVTYAGTLNQTNAARLAEIDGITGGAHAFTGTATAGAASTGLLIENATGGTATFADLDLGTAGGRMTNDALTVQNNTGGAFTFTDADIFTTGARGLFASANTGTSSIASGNGTTVNTIGASAVELNNSIIGAAGLLFGGITATNTGGNEGIEADGVTGGLFNDTGTTTVNTTAGGMVAGIDIQTSGAAFTFANLDIDTTSGAAVLLNGNAGTTTITGGTIDGTGTDGINATNSPLTVGTATPTGIVFGGTTAIGDDAIQVTSNDATARALTLLNNSSTATANITNRGVVIDSTGTGTLTATLGGNDIKSTNRTLETTDGGTADQLRLALGGGTYERGTAGTAVEITGSALNSTVVTAFQGQANEAFTVVGNGTGGGARFNRVTFDADPADGNFADDPVSANATNTPLQIGQGAVQRVQGDGLRFDLPSGTLNLTEVDIFNNAGTGLLVDTKTGGPTTFALTNNVATSDLDTTGGAAANLDPLTTNLTFASLTSTNSPTSGLILDTVTGTFTVTGATNITGPAADGILVTTSPVGTFNFQGTTTIALPGDDGIDLTGAGNPTMTFADIDITGLGGTATGLNLAGGEATFGATTLDITGTGAVGSRGIDLSGSLNNRTVTVTNGGNIANVSTGVVLGTNGAAAAGGNTNFTFGTGGDIGGTTFSLDTVGQNQVVGSYAFNATTFSAPFNFPAGDNLLFVGSAAAGAGDGSSVANRATITTADANVDGTVTFVLINDGATIDVNNAAGFTLVDGQTMASFDNGRTFNATGGQANVTGTNIPPGGTVNDPFANGGATLTNSGLGPTIALANGGANTLADFRVAGANAGITGTNVTGFTSTGLMVQNTGGNAVRFTNPTGNLSLTNIDVTDPTGIGLVLSGGTASLTADANSSIAQANNFAALAVQGGHNTGTLGYAGTINATNGTGLQFDNADGIYNFTGAVTLNGTGNAADTGIDILNGSAGTFTFANTAITSPTGAAFNVDGGTSTVNYTGGSITQANAAATVNVQGGHATGTLDFDVAVNATNGSGLQFNNADGTYRFDGTVTLDGTVLNADTGIDILAGSAGTFTFANLTQITNDQGFAVAMDSSPGAATFANLDINQAIGAGVVANNSGSLTVTSGAIDNAIGDGINTTNTNLTVGSNAPTGVAFGSTTAITGDAIEFVNNDATARTADFFNLTIGSDGDTNNVGGRGIFVAQAGGAGTVTVSLSGTNEIHATSHGLETQTAATGDILRLNVGAGATFETGSAGPAVEINGDTISATQNSTIVTGFSGVTVIGNGTGGGILFDNVTFDSDLAAIGTTAATADQVAFGATQIGQGVGARVDGDGVSFINPIGDVDVTTLNIFNAQDAILGVDIGLEVNTKGAGTDFELTGGGSGTIDTTGGPALFLDPFAGNLAFGTVTSLGSSTTGITVDAVALSGSGNALTITTLDVDNSSAQGVLIQNSTGGVSIADGDITGATGTAFQVGDGTANSGSTGAIAYGGTINNTTGRSVIVQDRAAMAGDVTLSGNITDNTPASSTGILIDDNAAGTIALSGTIKTVNTGANPAVTVTDNTGATVTFSGGGLDIDTTSGTGFTATGGGTVNVTGAGNRVDTTAGKALDIDTAALGATFASVSSAGSATEGIEIDNATGTIDMQGGSIATATGTSFDITGGTASVTYSGGITHSTAGTAAVAVSGGHNTGTVTFQTGTISATNGTGLQFDNADGTYNFTGTTTLNGTGNAADTGIDILDGSAGTFTFANTAITSPTGTAFNVDGGTSTVNYTGGSITQANNAAMVNVQGGHTTGTLDFDVAVNATLGTGLQFNNADGTYRFDGTTTLNGGDAGIDIINGSGGSFTFASTTITNPTGTAFNVNGGGGTINYNAGSISKTSAGEAVNMQNRTGGTATIGVNVTCTTNCTGLNFAGNSGGTTEFSGTTTTINTTASANTDAIEFASSGGHTLTFSGTTLDIDTSSGIGVDVDAGGTFNFTSGATTTTINASTTGKGFEGTSAGTLVVTGNAAITSTTGRGVDIDTTTIGAGGAAFRSVTVNGADIGIRLNATGNSGGLFLVSGDGSMTGGVFDRDGSGGTIQSTTGDAVSLTDANNVTLRQMNIQNCGNGTAGDDCIDSLRGGVHTLSAVNVSNATGTGAGLDFGNGWRLTDVTGNNRIDNDSLFTNFSVASTRAVQMRNTSTNGNLTISGSDFTAQGAGNSATYVTVQGFGTSTINFTVEGTRPGGAGTASTTAFSGLRGDAILAALESGSSGTMTTIIRNSDFLNAAANGSGAVAATVNQSGATHTVTIEDNIFNNLSTTLLAPVGIITTNIAGNGGNLNATIQRNDLDIIQGTRTGIQVVGQPTPTGAVIGTLMLTIDNNTIDRIPGNFAILVDTDDGIGTSTINITNNQIGQAAGFLGQVGDTFDGAVLVRTRGVPAATNTIVVSGNNIRANTDLDNPANLGGGRILFIDARDLRTSNIDILNNTIRNDDANADEEEIFVRTVTNSPTVCVNVDNNNLIDNTGTAGSGGVEFSETVGTLGVEDLANIGTRNQVTTVTVGAGVADSGSNCIP